MAFSALGSLQPESKKLWVKDAIRAYRENSFFTKFMGTDENSIVQLVTVLTKTEKGARAGIGLVPDLQSTGVVGDNDMEGHEEALDSSWTEIRIDQLRNATRSKGKMEDQKSVFEFRSQSRDKLAFWRARIMDELMILAASGISFRYQTDGSLRPVSGGQDDLSTLEFASDVSAPSSGRHFIVDSSGNFVNDTNANITAASTLSYNTIVDLKAEARTRGIKPVRMNGKEFHVFLCHPKAFAQLKKDTAFRQALEMSLERSSDHPVFTGAVVTMDGLIIAPTQRAYNTLGAASGSKWGAAGAVNGTRSLLLGAQSLAVCDLWDQAQWEEKGFDFNNKSGISIAMMFGILKPKFKSFYDSNTVQDFGVMALDSYIA